METRKTMALAFALLLFAGIASASVNPKVQLLNYSLSETPVAPGHVLTLTLHMKSMESDNCAENLAVQLTVSYPLSLRGSDTQYRELLCYQDPDANGTFVFQLPVDNLATSGTYPVAVSTTYEKRFTKLSESNTLNVQVGGSPSFVASVSSSSPVDIYPGDDAQVTVTFQNTGASTVQSARASAQSSGIQVKWAGQTQELGEIPARGSASATFSIEAPKNINSGAYPLYIKLDYIGEDTRQGSADFSFVVPVKPKADFLGDSDGVSLLPGERKEIPIQITNTGNEVARKLQVRLKPLFPFSTDGTVRYVESLQPGESKNLTYVITVDKDATSGGQLLSLLIDFENPQGEKFSDSSDFAMQVKLPGVVDDLVNYWYIVALVLIVGAFLLRRRAAAPAKKK
ncbi:Uncharacterised protein [uncultured archaeon]|nr:Uncharacterised protein [uncultured archaeon]